MQGGLAEMQAVLTIFNFFTASKIHLKRKSS